MLVVLLHWPVFVDANEWRLFISEKGGFYIMAPKPPVERPTLPHSGVFEFEGMGVVT